jgi:hypothetical protein
VTNGADTSRRSVVEVHAPARTLVSVLVEWENVLLAEEDRALVMLDRLREQSDALDADFEFLFLFNPDEAPEAEVRRSIEQRLVRGGLRPGSTLRLLGLPGEHYYELRNHGMAESSGDIILCLDSDVVPEPGWLEAIIGPLVADPAVQVVAGQTYIDPENLVARAFGAGWIFPVRSERDDLEPNAPGFYANNVAFRRSLTQTYPYPPLEQGETRGACRRLAATLKKNGLCIWRANAARVSHPAPNGFRHICTRALAEGRDNAVHWGRRGRGPVRRAVKGVKFALAGVRQTAVRSVRDRRALRSPLWQSPGLVAVMTGYYGLVLLGAWTQALLPAKYSQGWRI